MGRGVGEGEGYRKSIHLLYVVNYYIGITLEIYLIFEAVCTSRGGCDVWYSSSDVRLAIRPCDNCI